MIILQLELKPGCVVVESGTGIVSMCIQYETEDYTNVNKYYHETPYVTILTNVIVVHFSAAATSQLTIL